MSNEFEGRSLPDAEFDEYLQRGSEVSQRYRELGSRAVPPLLDAKVLQQAQQESERLRKRTQRSWLRWGAPLAVAATALIAVSVVLQPGVQESASIAGRAPQAMIADQPAAAPPRSEEPADALADSTSAAAPRMLESPQAVAPPEPDTGSRRLAAPSTSQEQQARSQLTADEADLRAAEARKDAQQITPTESSSALVLGSSNAIRDKVYVQQPPVAPPEAAVPPQPVPEPVAAPEAPAAAVAAPAPATPVVEAAPPPAAEPKAETETRATRTAGGARAERNRNRRGIPPPPVAPAAAPPPLVPLPESVDSAVVATAPAPPAIAKPKADEERRSAVTDRLFAQPSSRAAAEAAPPNPELDRAIPPDVWVKWIRDLRTEGNAKVAETFLQRLRAAHPDFQLPSDLAGAQR